MTYNTIDWALQQEICDPVAKLVLVILSKHADKKEMAWPSLNNIADCLSRTTDTARRKIRILEKMGLVVREVRHRNNGGQTSNIYRLVSGLVVDSTPLAELTVSDSNARGEGGIDAREAPGMDATPPPGTNARGIILKKPEGKNQKEYNPQTPKGANSHTEPSTKKTKRKFMIDDDWQPSEKTKNWCLENYEIKQSGMDELIAEMKDNHISKGNKFIDWDRAFQTWVRNSVKFNNLKKRAKPIKSVKAPQKDADGKTQYERDWEEAQQALMADHDRIWGHG